LFASLARPASLSLVLRSGVLGMILRIILGLVVLVGLLTGTVVVGVVEQKRPKFLKVVGAYLFAKVRKTLVLDK